MWTVAIIAAQRDTRERCSLLLADGGCDVVARAAAPHDVKRVADATIIFCDSPNAEGMLLQASVALPGSRLVIVLADVTRHGLRRAIRTGAAAVVREKTIDESLLIAVQSVCTGHLSVPLDFADRLEKPVLSTREKQILGMVVMGFTNSQVARRLFLAESTVKSHMSAIFGKLGVGSRKEAVALVLDPEEGLGLGILSISDEPDTSAGAPSATAA